MLDLSDFINVGSRNSFGPDPELPISLICLPSIPYRYTFEGFKEETIILSLSIRVNELRSPSSPMFSARTVRLSNSNTEFELFTIILDDFSGLHEKNPTLAMIISLTRCFIIFAIYAQCPLIEPSII